MLNKSHSLKIFVSFMFSDIVGNGWGEVLTKSWFCVRLLSGNKKVHIIRNWYCSTSNKNILGIVRQFQCIELKQRYIAVVVVL